MRNSQIGYCDNITYHTVELASFVALWLTTVVLGLASAELTKVLSGLWHDILVQFHLNPPQLLACPAQVSNPSAG
jgi:hypothetical protein